MSFPVTFEVERPPVFQRAHVFLRVALLIVVGWIGHPFGLLWLGLPVVAAILVSQKGGQRYLDENGPTVTRVVHGFGCPNQQPPEGDVWCRSFACATTAAHAAR